MSTISLAKRAVYFSIKDPGATRSLVNHLIKSPNDSIVLPHIDYPGPLPEEILSRDFKLLTVCERDQKLRENFRAFVETKYPNKNVQLYSDDLLDLSYKTHCDSAQKRCAEIVKAANPSNDNSHNCDAPVKLLVPLQKSRYEIGFLRNVYYQVCCRLGLCLNSLVHYYFLMSDRQHTYLEARPGHNLHHYRSASVLFNTLFNLKTLESYDLKECFGINVKKIQNTSANNIEFYRKVHLVWFEPRLDVINTLNPRSWIEFRFLVTQMMTKRKGLAVTFLDRFFDGYRKDVSLFGIEDSTRSGDMSKEQYFNLFLYLRDRPDYKMSTFLHAVASSEEKVLSFQD